MPTGPQRRAAPVPTMKALSGKTFDTNMVRSVKGVLRSSFPSRNMIHSLYVLRQAGLDLERGTSTTTNFEEVPRDEIALAVDGNKTEEFDLEMFYDANDRKSIDEICDCCRGWGTYVDNARVPSYTSRTDMSLNCLSWQEAMLGSEADRE